MVIDELINRVDQGDADALIELDKRGLLPGADETLEQYVARLRCLQANIAAMNRALDESGHYEVEGISVEAAERIPAELCAGAREVTEQLYAFGIDWVPGFFLNPRFGWLFGGCAFYFYPDFFALFIIRKSFANRARWLIYTRRELLAHELCHVARIGMSGICFEELLAYQTATSRFRRAMGSVFRSPRDPYLVLGALIVLLVASVVQPCFLPRLWLWPFWCPLAAVAVFLGGRLFRNRRTFAAARRNLAHTISQWPLAVLFRCTDSEILTVAELDDAKELAAWVRERSKESIRWQIIRARFLAGEGPSPPE